MHEFGITQSILDTALENAIAANATRITQLNLMLSATSHITEDSVEMYFAAISKGSMAEGAVLVFERERSEFRCWSCEHEFAADIPYPVCPKCNEAAQALPTDEEFYLESIDIE